MSERRIRDLIGDAGELIERQSGREGVDLSRFRDDPVAFAAGMDREPLDYQADVMQSVAAHRLNVWRGCHGCGKEYTEGLLAAWGALVRGMLVLVVSATETQVVGQTMREVAASFRAAARAYGVGFDRYQRSIRIGDEDRVIALTGGASVDALTGWHDPHGVLVLISEGQGERLEDSAYDAAIACASDDRSRVLAAGNPIRPTGRFYEVNQKAHWNVFRTSAFDTPNVKAGETVVPGCPSPTWPQEVAREYDGEDSPYYISRVLAEFPAESEDAAFPTAAIDAAFERTVDVPMHTDYVLGVDPAGPGADSTAVVVWHGRQVVEYHTWRRLEAPEVADKIEDIMRQLRRGPGRHLTGADVGSIWVDEIGIGHGLVGILKRRARSDEWMGLRVHGVHISKRPGEPKRFVRRKDELTWALREDLVEGRVGFAPNDRLREELLEVRMHQTPDGKHETEQKKAMKARLGRSPDLLDALLLGISPTVPEGKKQARLIA